jgi:hypothetical protein
MKVEAYDGCPRVEESARGLGVRPGIDIPVDDYGLVEPGSGGMSCSPDDPGNLPHWRRPEEHGGTGDDPVWQLEENELGGLLVYTGESQIHGLVEPAYQMPLDDYQAAIAETRQLWRRC